MAGSAIPITLLNWNIYGLHAGHLKERTEYICDYILSRSPTVVYLQEVVHSTWPMITSKLNELYTCYCGVPRCHYFNGLLVRKSPDITLLSEREEVVEFPTSGMGRYLIGLPVCVHGSNVYFLTSHIESLDQDRNIIERKKQIREALKMMTDKHKNDGFVSCVFGGDLNTKDSEISEIGLPEGVIDIWEATGSNSKEKKTWNTNVPVVRCDRVYFCPKDGPLVPTSFSLIGGERLKGLGCFPSDHFGIWIEFKLNKN